MTAVSLSAGSRAQEEIPGELVLAGNGFSGLNLQVSSHAFLAGTVRRSDNLVGVTLFEGGAFSGHLISRGH